MNLSPLMFSMVTGFLLAVLGAGVAGSGIAGWGLFTVGLGVLAISLLSYTSARSQVLAPARNDLARLSHASVN